MFSCIFLLQSLNHAKYFRILFSYAFGRQLRNDQCFYIFEIIKCFYWIRRLALFLILLKRKFLLWILLYLLKENLTRLALRKSVFITLINQEMNSVGWLNFKTYSEYWFLKSNYIYYFSPGMSRFQM